MDKHFFFSTQELQENGKSRECDFSISVEPLFFQGMLQGSECIFYLSTKIISAPFSNLETLTEQHQISILEQKSGPSVTGNNETLGTPSRRQCNFISEVIPMLFCTFAFLCSDFHIENVAIIILFNRMGI